MNKYQTNEAGSALSGSNENETKRKLFYFHYFHAKLDQALRSNQLSRKLHQLTQKNLLVIFSRSLVALRVNVKHKLHTFIIRFEPSLSLSLFKTR